MNRLSCYLKKSADHPLITGTLILTAAGLASRLIGFFYRIYLSRLFGEAGMGIYQLISPVISLSFSLCAAAYQTAVSKLSAELAAKYADSCTQETFRPLTAAVSISLPLSLLCTFLTYKGADFIGTVLIKETRTIPLLKIIAFSFPFVGIHACINGWLYGMKKAALPSAAQLIEQLTRVLCVYIITGKDFSLGKMPSVSSAVFGLAVGEVVSMTFAILTFLPFCKKANNHSCQITPALSSTTLYKNLFSMALPLTANRLVLNLLGSIESVAIPERLRLFGYDTDTALSVFGVLTGMALPLIFFPNALTGSIAVMLLPMISENNCLKRYDCVRKLTFQTLKYCLYMGFACLGVFAVLGPWIGTHIFHSALAGNFIRTLGFICPFLYLDSTLSSILQGLGKAGSIFVINVLSLSLRLLFVFFAIPVFGMKGYLWGMLSGQLLLSLLYLICLQRFFHSHK